MAGGSVVGRLTPRAVEIDDRLWMFVMSTRDPDATAAALTAWLIEHRAEVRNFGRLLRRLGRRRRGCVCERWGERH